MKIASKQALLKVLGLSLLVGSAALAEPLPAGSANASGPVIDQEIVELEDGALLPAAKFDKYDTRTLGRAIVQRMHLREQVDETQPATPYPILSKSSIVIFFPPKVAGPIIEKGFLNQHQCQSSCGMFNPAMRANVEVGLSRLKFEETYVPDAATPANKLRPKYAYMNFHEQVPFNTKAPYNYYGGAAAVLKEEVKQRSTWTVGDSLNNSGFTADLSAILKSLDSIKAFQATFFSSGISKHNISSTYYAEAQIWGELDLRDVQHFLVRDGALDTELSATGLPIYDMVVERIADNLTYENEVVKAGAQRYAGDPVRIEAYEKDLQGSKRQ
jgi:hypothetical protein